MPEPTRSEHCFERPPKHRIDEILAHRKHNATHLYLRYAARRDYLQLCCEIEYLRTDIVDLIAALRGIISVSDRNTLEYLAAKVSIAKAECRL